MSAKKKVIISLIVTLAVIGISVGVVLILKNRTRSNKSAAVYPISDLGYMDYWGDNNTLSGSVAVNMEQKIYMSASQQIKEVCVEEGDVVKAGDVLMVYDTTAQGLKLETKRAEVEVARVAVVVAERELTELQNTTPVEPTTEEPTTEEPTTEEPTTEEPTTEEPTTEEPTTEEPTTEEPINPTEPTDPPVTTNANNVQPLQQPVHMTGDVQDVQPDVPENSGEDGYTKEELEKAIAEKQSEIKKLNIDYQLAQLELEIMEYQSANGDVLCNFDGVVKKVVDQDTALMDNEPLIVVSGTDGYTVQASIGEMALASVGVGDTVSMYSYDNGMTYEGVITEISDIPYEDGYYYSSKEESFYPITIAITEGEDLQQGMYMEITVNSESESADDSFYLAMAFLMKENGNYYVMKEVDGRLVKTYVKTGKIIWGDTIEIKAGLTMDDYVALPYSKTAQEGVKTVHKTTADLY